MQEPAHIFYDQPITTVWIQTQSLIQEDISLLEIY